MASAIEDIIDELEEYIDSCKPSSIFNDTKIVVNRDDIEGLLEELRAKTPEEIRRYQKIISNKEAILADARAKADQIVQEAQITTNELVSEHQIMQQAYAQANEVVMIATKQAQEMLDAATNDANDIRTGAIAYTDQLLRSIQDVLAASIDTTRQRNETFLKTMQGYLDVVVSNRTELAPETQAPDVVKPAAVSDVNKENHGAVNASKKEPIVSGTNKTEVTTKEDSEEALAVLDIPESFFNKE